MSNENSGCPECGDKYIGAYHEVSDEYSPNLSGKQYVCATIVWENGVVEESHECLRSQLATQTARAIKYMRAVEQHDLEWSEKIVTLKAQLAGAKAKAEILEGFFCDGVVAWSLLTKNNMAEAGEAMFDILNILSSTPEALAVVEGVLVHKDKFNQQSVFVDDQAAIWRPSECEHPEYRKALLVVLPRSEGGE